MSPAATGARRLAVPPHQWKWAGAIVVVFLVGVLLPHSWAPDSGSHSPPAAAKSLPAALTSPPDVAKKVGLQVYGSDPSLAFDAPTDHFNRDNAATLGRSTLGAWTSVLGQWHIINGEAVAVAPVRGVRLATITGPGSGLVAQVRLAVVGDQAGLAFGVTNQRNYWALVVTSDSTVELLSVSRGQLAKPIALRHVALHADMTLAVRIFGATASLLVDGRIVGTHEVGPVGHGVGLYWAGSALGPIACFDDFVLQKI